MKKFKFSSLLVLSLAVMIGSAFSPRFSTQYFTYSGSNEFLPGSYTLVPGQPTFGGPNTDLAWIEVDATEIYPAGHPSEYRPMVDEPSTNIRAALSLALTNPKTDITITFPVRARVQLKPWYLK